MKTKLIRNSMIKSHLCTLITLAAFNPAISMAALYECNTEQVFGWKKGNLTLDKSVNARKNEILRFDDESGVLSAAFEEGSPFISMNMEVVHPMSAGSGLTAISTSKEKGVFLGTDVFRLRQNKAKTNFLSYSSGDNRIAVGSCIIVSN